MKQKLEVGKKIVSDKDFTELKEKVKNLYLTDAIVELFNGKLKEINKWAYVLTSYTKALNGDEENYNEVPRMAKYIMFIFLLSC